MSDYEHLPTPGPWLWVFAGTMTGIASASFAFTGGRSPPDCDVGPRGQGSAGQAWQKVTRPSRPGDMRDLRISRRGSFAQSVTTLKAKEANMEMPDVDKSLARLGVTRQMRKKIGRVSRSPKLRAAAALVPILTAGLLAARRFARKGS